MQKKPKGAYDHKGIWHARFRFRGVEYRPSTGLRVGEAACLEVERAARRLRSDVEAGAAPPRDSGRGPFLVDLAAADQERKRAPGYAAAVESMWRNLLGHFGDVALSAITYESVVGYETARRAGKVTPLPVPPKPGKERRKNAILTARKPARGQTISEEIDCLKRVFVIAKRRKLIAAVPPASDWPTIKHDAAHPTRRGRLIHPKHLRALLPELALEMREAVIFDALTGLRFEELHRVTRAWVREDLDHGYVLEAPADGTKDREERPIPLTNAAAAIFFARANAARDRGEFDALLFPKVDRRKSVKSACTRAGLPSHITYRDLRTTFANLAKRAGQGTAAQALMGHADERTLAIYLRHDLAEMATTVKAIEAALLPSDTGPGWAPEGGHPKEGAHPKENGRISVSTDPPVTSTSRGARIRTGDLLVPNQVGIGQVACPCCLLRCQTLHGSPENANNSHVCPPEVGTQGGHPDGRVAAA